MNAYELVEKDQPKSSWAVFDLIKKLPKRQKNPELPPVLYTFFGPEPDGEMQIKPQFSKLRCKTCGRFDEDAVFDIGFFDPVNIRIKGDFASTQDRVFAISEKMLKVLRDAKVLGYVTKAIGTSGWHAMKVTERVDCDESVIQSIAPFCPECGRPDRAPGAFTQLKQLSIPKRQNTFFTTKKGWAKPFSSRYIHLTEDVAQLLKAAGIKGGWCVRLLTDEEVRIAGDKAKQGKKWKPSGVMLSL